MRCASSPAVHRHVEQPLGRLVHEDDVALRVGDEDRIGNRVDDEIQPVPLVAHLRLRHPQRAIALFDLLARVRQVGDVAQDRDDVGALTLVASARAEKLEQQVGALERIDKQKLAAREIGVASRRRRECRRKKHVVERDGAAPALARVVRRGK